MKVLVWCAAFAALIAGPRMRAQMCGTTAAPAYFSAQTDGPGMRFPLTIGPVSWRLMGPPIQPVKGSDGLIHLAYSLQLTNSWNREATVSGIEVVDPAKGNAVTGTDRVMTASDKPITGQMRLLALPGTADVANFSTRLAGGQAAIVYLDVTYKDTAEVPRAIAHRFAESVLDQEGKPTAFTMLSPPLPLNCEGPIVLQPPVKGDGWVDGNGCCTEIGPHRFVMNSVNGELQPTEAFAIDWIRIDAKGELVHGDVNKPKDWVTYGVDLLAVGPGTIVEVVSNLPDVPPSKAPVGLTLEQIAGNRVILDLGSGHYAEYDHIVPNSVVVRVGEHVTTGQKLGLLGNSGNSTGPHLHFQLMNRPSTLDGSALPFVFDTMELQGRIAGDLNTFGESGDRGETQRILPISKKLDHAMPLSMDVVSFR
jgi:Peptidase family M23